MIIARAVREGAAAELRAEPEPDVRGSGEKFKHPKRQGGYLHTTHPSAAVRWHHADARNDPSQGGESLIGTAALVDASVKRKRSHPVAPPGRRVGPRVPRARSSTRWTSCTTVAERHRGGEAFSHRRMSLKTGVGAKVPLRPSAFRPTALPGLPCRLLAGLLHCPPHLLVSQLSVDLPHLLQPLLQHRVLEAVPFVRTTVTSVNRCGLDPLDFLLQLFGVLGWVLLSVRLPVPPRYGIRRLFSVVYL